MIAVAPVAGLRLILKMTTMTGMSDMIPFEEVANDRGRSESLV